MRIDLRKRYSRLLNVCLIIITGCLEPYPAPEGKENLNILVADGFLDSGNGIAVVKLSHSTPLSEVSAPAPESNAAVRIIDGLGNATPLAENQPGTYSIAGLIPDPLVLYQLAIRTADGEEYLSDLVTVTRTPPIDSITWKPEDRGLTIYANTHDSSDKSRYYRWEYVETWEYHAPFSSDFTTLNKKAVLRDRKDLFYTCYKTVPSTKIALGTSVRLTSDLIRDQPLIFLPAESDQLMVRYSVLVKQRVLDKKEYDFWSDLQRVTENLGGLFDSQPYQILGNVHHTNDVSRPVLGYFSVGSTDEQRLFIGYRELPQYLQRRPAHGCLVDTVCLIKTPNTIQKCIIDLPNISDGANLIAALSTDGTIWGYTVATPECADCRAKGGVLEKPSFWPQ